MKLLSLAMLAAGAQSAIACDLCAIYAANQARGDIGRGPFVGVAEQYTHFGTVQIDGRPVSDPSHQHLGSAISQMFVGYNFTRRFGVQFTAPLIYRSYKRPNDEGGIEHGTESGLGDVAVLANVLAYRVSKMDRTLNWSLLGGVKF